MTTPDQTTSAQPKISLQDLVERSGISADEIRELAREADATEDRETVGEHAERFLPVLDEGTRRTYSTAIRRFVYGFGPVCDSDCEPCCDRRYDYQCRCDCRSCRSSRITLPDISNKPVSSDVYNRSTLEMVAKVALRSAKKRGADENRRRAAKGKPAKRADGRGAQESAVAALRALFQRAPEHIDGYDGRDVEKPHKSSNGRRPFRDYELVELFHLTCVGGNDPELDGLLVEFGLHCGSRRLGAYSFTIGQIRPKSQMLRLKDKHGDEVDMPVSAELIERIRKQAVERGGSRCDPNSPEYDPNSPVFYYKARGGGFKPITSRRFDTLAGRWQRELPWAAEEQVGYHHLRHTVAEYLKANYGQHYAKRYLRHGSDSVTDIYGKCTTEELARAMSELFGYEHPLVTGHDRRRAEVKRRLGFE